jgi:hypothetical protein
LLFSADESPGITNCHARIQLEESAYVLRTSVEKDIDQGLALLDGDFVHGAAQTGFVFSGVQSWTLSNIVEECGGLYHLKIAHRSAFF